MLITKVGQKIGSGVQVYQPNFLIIFISPNTIEIFVDKMIIIIIKSESKNVFIKHKFEFTKFPLTPIWVLKLTFNLQTSPPTPHKSYAMFRNPRTSVQHDVSNLSF